MQNIKVKIYLKNILGYYSRNCNTVDIPFKAFSNTRVHNTRDGGCFAHLPSPRANRLPRHTRAWKLSSQLCCCMCQAYTWSLRRFQQLWCRWFSYGRGTGGCHTHTQEYQEIIPTSDIKLSSVWELWWAELTASRHGTLDGVLKEVGV